MRKKHFRLGIVVLVGLAGYFLVLSAALMASAGISDSVGFRVSVRNKPHLQKGLPQEQTAKFRSKVKSAGHKSGAHTASLSGNKPDPCSVPACGTTISPALDGLSSWNRSGLGTSGSANGQHGLFDRNQPSPIPYGFNFFGPALAFEPTGGAGDNAGTSQNGDGVGSTGSDPKGGTSPDFINSNPGPNLSPDDPPGLGGPFISTGNPPPDPAPQFNPSGTITVPEPPTVWLFFTSLTILAAGLGFTARTRPASTGLDDVGQLKRRSCDGKPASGFRKRWRRPH